MASCCVVQHGLKHVLHHDGILQCVMAPSYVACYDLKVHRVPWPLVIQCVKVANECNVTQSQAV